MAETASANPNTPVATEAKVESKANSAVSFHDLDALEDRPVPKAEKKPAGPTPTGKAKAVAKDSADEKGKAKPADKGNKAKVADADDAEEGDDADDDKGETKDPPKAKPKTHRFRSGDVETAVSGDSIIAVPINGKKEEVPLQELINNYSGKVAYDAKFGDLGKKEQAHTERVEQLNGKINGLLEKAKANPEDGWDFLADLTGQDPVPLKEQMLRGWIAELSPLFSMPEDQREAWIKDKVRDWRDRRYENRQKAETEQSEKARKIELETKAREHYGISADRYSEAADIAKRHLEGGEPTSDQVIYTERYMTAREVVHEVVPNLAKHDKFADIMEDIVQHQLRYPEVTREKLAKLLKESWGQDDESLKSLSRKASRNAESDGESLSSSRGSKKANSEPLSFADL